MSAGQVFAVVIVLLGISTPFTALAAYSFGWWYRGRWEAKKTVAPSPIPAHDATRAAFEAECG